MPYWTPSHVLQGPKAIRIRPLQHPRILFPCGRNLRHQVLEPHFHVFAALIFSWFDIRLGICFLFPLWLLAFSLQIAVLTLALGPLSPEFVFLLPLLDSLCVNCAHVALKIKGKL